MPKVLPLTIYPHPLLRQKARTLSSEELQKKEVQQLILDMEKTMIAKDGIGLAAPQVGHGYRLAVINTEDGSLVLINPRILRSSWRKELGEEGCLSIPQVFGLVKRSERIRLVALDKTGKKITFTARGMFARVIQHEVDHLNGVLFIDRTKKLTQGTEELKKLRGAASKATAAL